MDGIGVYTAALEKALRQLGIDVRRVGARAGPNLRPAAGADVRFGLPLAATIAFSALSGLPTPFAGRVARAVDLYHSTDYRVPRLAAIPVVATLYDAIPLAHPEWANARLRQVKNWLLRAAARNADRVIAISHAAAHEVRCHYKVSDDRIRVVHLGVDEGWFDPTGACDEVIVRDLGLQPGYVLFVGTLQPRKDVATLLGAYDALPRDVRDSRQLVIVGKYGWGAEPLRLELEARRPQGRVVWLRYLPLDRLRAVYRAAGAFAFPSLAEGFGLPVLEALASGVPVAASDIPAVREVAQTSAAYCRPGDRESLAEAILAALSAPRGAVADGVRREAARGFDWATCARGTLAVYRELLPA